ncbi:MAG: hypothetical protein C0402_11160, partial [Thermodesulfovibrio sp.]|nr:hypothetical protein [Thermodesulfovibrio sp.]
MKNVTKTIKILIVACFALLLAQGAVWAAYDQPHTIDNGVDCGNCHYTTGAGSPPSWMSAGSGDNTVNNLRCTQCHGLHKTHSTTTTASTMWQTMGGWMVECVDCHNPHYQMQSKRWGTVSYIATGTLAGVGSWNTVANEMPLTLSAPLGAEYQNYYLIPNTAYRGFVYKIKTATNGQSSVTVAGKVGTGTTFPKAAAGTQYAIVYGKNVKDAISVANPGGATVGSATVKMFRTSGTRGPGDSAFPTESVCFVCHTLADPANATGVTEHSQASAACASCHAHDEGFKGGGCDTCHGNPPVTNIVGGTAPMTGLAVPATGSLTSGKHQKHATSGGTNLAYACSYCHKVQDMNNAKIDLGFNFFGYTSIGSYDGRILPGGKYQAQPGTTLTQTGTLNCNNIYCHSTAQGASGTGVPTYKTAQWLDTAGALVCSSCHNDMAGVTATGSHIKHANNAAANYNMPCSNCHTGYTSGTTNAALHVNNIIDVTMSTGSYSGGTTNGNNAPGGGYGNCSSVYCHSTGTAAPAYYTAVWGSTGSGACGTCHGNNAANVPSSTRHAQHVGTAQGYKFSCSKCHDSVVMATTDSTGWATIKSTTLHVDGTRNVKFDSFNSIGGYAGTTCSSIYCHGDGQSVATGAPHSGSADWSVTLTCAGCHGTSTADGRPDYTNWTSKANSHISSTTHAAQGCQVCHFITTANGTTISTFSNHVNKIYNVVAWGSTSFNYAYNARGGTCSAVSCHGGNSGVWGSSGSLACGSCHAVNNSLAGQHNNHWATVGAGSLAPANLSNATQYKFSCGICHFSTNHGGGWASTNRTAEVAFWTTLAGSGTFTQGATSVLDGTYRYTNSTCSTTYCHSNGAGAAGKVTTFNWVTSSGAFVTAVQQCSFCH